MKTFQGCRTAFLSICIELGFEPEQIRSGRRDAALVKKKIAVGKALRNAGYTLPQIGAAMNKHHTTIMHYLGKNDD